MLKTLVFGLLTLYMLTPGIGLARDHVILLDASSVPLSESLNPGDRVDKIRFYGMLALPGITVDGKRFTQLSGLAWDDDDGILYAISDKGSLFHLKPLFTNQVLTGVKLLKAVSLQEVGNHKPLKGRRADAEGLEIHNGRNGRRGDAEVLISFERFPRIVRYHTDGRAVRVYFLPAPLNDIKAYRNANKATESVCLDEKYGLLTTPEAPLNNMEDGYTRIFSLSGKSWVYPLVEGNQIAALECLGDGRVLILERDFGSMFGRGVVSLKKTTLPGNPSPSIPVSVETMVTLDSRKGFQIDNFEGLTRHRGNRFFMISDDNDLFVQRTLLLYFELLENKNNINN
ncbi:MAG: esterase-like activity of phytase family protein [Gammaproteobacteria bacterium]|nr:MAG: esterase-like activity of phytase family protein [Gammaproteobacteria bacterium]